MHSCVPRRHSCRRPRIHGAEASSETRRGTHERVRHGGGAAASASGLLRASRRFYGAHQRSIGGMPGGFPFSTETCILIAKYEETCPVTAHLVGRVGADVSP